MSLAFSSNRKAALRLGGFPVFTSEQIDTDYGAVTVKFVALVAVPPVVVI